MRLNLRMSVKFCFRIRDSNAVLFYIVGHLFEGHALGSSPASSISLSARWRVWQSPTVHKRIGKPAHMAACYPSLRVHENGAVKSDVVGRLLNKLFPPGLFYVVFIFYAERTEVPRIRKTAVYFGARIYKTAVLQRATILSIDFSVAFMIF